MNNTILLIIGLLIGICILFSIQGCLKVKEGLQDNDNDNNGGGDDNGDDDGDDGGDDEDDGDDNGDDDGDTDDDNDASDNDVSTSNISSCLEGAVADLVQQNMPTNNGSNGNTNGNGDGYNGSSNGNGNGIDASNIKVYNPSDGESSMIFPGTTVIIFEDSGSANGKNATDSSYADSIHPLTAGARVAQQFADLSGNGAVPSSKGGYSSMEGYQTNTFSNSESADNITSSSGSTNSKTSSNGDIYNHASYDSWSTPRTAPDLRTTNMFAADSIPYSHFNQPNAFPLSSDGNYNTANMGPLASNVIDYIHTKK